MDSTTRPSLRDGEQYSSGPVEWLYEPQAFADERGQYLPDFWQRYNGWEHYTEVKPRSCRPTAMIQAFRKMHIILASLPDALLDFCIGSWADGEWDFEPWIGCYPQDRAREAFCPVCSPDLVEWVAILDPDRPISGPDL